MTVTYAERTAARPPSSTQVYKAVAAASIGNALEWYDLTLYLYFAVPLSKLFFPTDNRTVSVLLTLGTFGISYLMRPLGAVVLGLYADERGRKSALMLSISLMMVGTLIMAVSASGLGSIPARRRARRGGVAASARRAARYSAYFSGADLLGNAGISRRG